VKRGNATRAPEDAGMRSARRGIRVRGGSESVI
jgi:hypothetical protein